MQGDGRPSTERSAAGLPSYAYLISLLTAFTVIAIDVNADSLHLLQPLDNLVHTTVSTNIPFDFRANVADKVISDTPIHTGAAMIVAGIAVIATTRPKQAAAIAGLFAAFNFTCVPSTHPPAMPFTANSHITHSKCVTPPLSSQQAEACTASVVCETNSNC